MCSVDPHQAGRKGARREMYRLLIADDEPIIREGLMSGIDWEALGFVATASFASGNDIIEYLKNNPADVLLSDIVMRRGSGLDAAEWIASNRPRMCVVLFTGYSDFGMACRAVSCRSVRYLLKKPTQLGEIKETFLNVARELSTRIDDAHAEGLAERLIADLFTIMENDRMSTDGNDVYVVAFLPDRDTAGLNAPEFIIDGSPLRGFTVRQGDRAYVIWRCRPEARTEIERRAEAWLSIALPVGKGEVIGFSDVGELLSRFASDRAGQTQRLQADEWHARIDRAFDDGDWQSLSDVFHEAVRAEAPFNALNLMAEKADLRRSLLLRQRSAVDDGIMHARLIRIAAQPGDRQAYLTWIRDLIDTLAPGEDGDRTFMLTLNRYLEDHVSEGLLLQDVAQALFFSPGYLSRLIKEKTGMNFSEYVLNFKISCARADLTTTAMSISDVGRRIGYYDTRHFARMFRRVTGCTPSQYRRSRRRGTVTDGSDRTDG